MSQRPKVSIIIPTYNSEALIGATLVSVINQSFVDWECIVIDDGSSDKSIAICLQFANDDNRIKVFKRSRDPKSASTCRNIGLQHAKGFYIIFLDSDDLLSVDCLKNRIAYMKRNERLDFAVFQMETFGMAKFLLTKHSSSYYKSFLAFDLPWAITGPIWKREYLLELGGFDEKINRLQDPDLHVRALLRKPSFEVLFNEEPDSFYRYWKSYQRRKDASYESKILSFDYFVRKFVNVLIPEHRKLLANYLYLMTMNFIWPLNEREKAILKGMLSLSRSQQIVGPFKSAVILFIEKTLPIFFFFRMEKLLLYGTAFLFSPSRFKRDYFH